MIEKHGRHFASMAEVRRFEFSKTNIKIPVNLDDGELLTMKEFVDAVKCGALIDYDGFGHYSDGESIFPNACIYPSQVEIGTILEGFTHVMWYNR